MTAAHLTTRELEVLEHMARGLRAVEIAGAMGVVEKTVKAHKRSAFRKMGARTSQQGMYQAALSGLVRLEDGSQGEFSMNITTQTELSRRRLDAG